MGRLQPKDKVAEEKKLKRQQKSDKKRKVGTRNVMISFLIVCEGERTEPLYFQALVKNRFSAVCEVRIEGEGRGTVSLVKEAIKIRDNSYKEFDRVWVVFDKDDFDDFNDAVRLAGKNNINTAWSNESFELWYYLHFEYLDTGVSRSRYIEMIEREIRKKSGDKGYEYIKKSEGNFAILQKYGDESLAFRRAEKLRGNYKGKDYASHKPCTTVDTLVKELNRPEDLLL